MLEVCIRADDILHNGIAYGRQKIGYCQKECGLNVFHLNLKTVLQLLQEFNRDGTLHTTIPAGALGTKEHCWGRLALVQGKITFCSITNEHGQPLLVNEEALRFLYQLEALNWEWTTRQEDVVSTSAEPEAFTPSPIPQRIAHVSQEELHSWPRMYRRVFVLIDGQRDVAKIALMLALSPKGAEELQEVLYELQRMGKIIVKQ